MKEFLELSYTYKDMYPDKSKEIEALVDECLKGLESGAKKTYTIHKYKRLLWILTKEDDE